MLQEGFHKSFCELFALIKQQEDDRLAAGPESLMWTMVLLKDEHEKLDMLKLHLTRAETAARKGQLMHCVLISGGCVHLKKICHTSLQLVTFTATYEPPHGKTNNVVSEQV